MSDIVELLHHGVNTNAPPDETDRVMAEAADEIERLRADRKQYEDWAEEVKLNISVMQTEIERLRAALRAMREAPYEQPIGCWFGAINAALEGTNTKHQTKPSELSNRKTK